MQSDKCFLYKDYINHVDTVMMGVVPVRDAQLHRSLTQTSVKKVEKQIIIAKPQSKQYIVSKERIESENIQLMVQNNDKLIAFLSCVKSKKGIDSVMFVTDNCICVIIKSQNLHPILVMKFPLSDITVYARSNNLVFDLPLDDLFQRSSVTFPSSKGYALYYKIVDDVISLHYEFDDGSTSVPSIGERNIDYINLILQPSVGDDLQKTIINNKNIELMNSISLLMLSKVSTATVFKECNYTKSEESIEFQIQPNSNGMSTMHMIIVNTSHAKQKRPIVDESTALVWKFKANQSFKMNKRTLLLLMSVHNKIKVGTDSLYFAFGRFGSIYVFLKLITLKPIILTDISAPIINLSKILEGIPYIYEMFYCY